MSSIAGDFNRIHVMSGGAPKEIFALLAPKFEQQTGNKVKFTYAVIMELREKLDAGATADVLVLPTPVSTVSLRTARCAPTAIVRFNSTTSAGVNLPP
jgi:accessory colonization factor AcfC